MSGFIEDFYYGNIEPQEFSSDFYSKLKKLLNALSEKEKTLDSMLTGEEKELFSKYVDTYNELSAVSIADGFISGFRLGAKFAYDVFVKGNN